MLMESTRDTDIDFCVETFQHYGDGQQQRTLSLIELCAFFADREQEVQRLPRLLCDCT